MEGETQASSAEVEVQLPTKLEVEVEGDENLVNGKPHLSTKGGSKEDMEEEVTSDDFIKIEKESIDVKEVPHSVTPVAKVDEIPSAKSSDSSNLATNANLQEVDEKIKALEQQLAIVSRQLEDSESEKLRFKSEIGLAQEKLEKMEKHCEQLESDRVGLKDEVLEAELKYTKQLESLQEALGALEVKQKELVDVKEAFSGLSAELENSKKVMEEFESKLVISAAEARKFEDLSNEKSSHAEVQAKKALEFENMLEAAKLGAKDMEDQIGNLQEELKGLYDKITENQKVEEALSATVAELSATREMLQFSNSKITDLEQKLASEDSTIHDLTEQLNLRKVSEEQMREDIVALESLLSASKEESQAKVAKLEELDAKLLEELKMRQTFEESLKAHGTQTSNLLEEVTKLSAEKEALENTISDLNTNLLMNKELCNELEEKLNLADTNLGNTALLLTQALSKIEELELKQKVLEDSLEESKKSAEAEIQKNLELDALLQASKASEEDVKSQLKETEVKLSGEKEALENTISDLNTNLSMNKELCNELEERLNLADTNLGNTALLLTQALSKIEELELKQKVLEDSLEESKKSAEAEIQKNLELDALLQASKASEEDVKSQLKETEVKLMSTEKQSTELEQQLALAELRFTDADREINELKEKTAELTTLLKEADEAKELSRCHFQAYEDRIGQLESSLGSSRTKHEALEQELKQLAEKCTEHEGRASETHQRNLELENLVQASHSQAEDAGKKASELDLLLETANYRTQELENLVSVMETKHRDAEAEATQHGVRISEISAELEAFQAKSASLEVLLQTANVKEQELADMLSTTTDEKKKFEELSKLYAEKLGHAENVVDVLQGELKSVRENVASFEEDLQAFTVREAELLEKLRFTEEQLEHHGQAAEQANARSLELESLHNSFSKESELKLQAALESISQKDSETRQLLKEVKSLDEQVLLYQNQALEATEKVASLKAELEANAIKFVALEETIDDLKRKLAEIEGKAEQSSSENELLAGTNKKLREELETHQLKVNELMSSIHTEKEATAEQLASHMKTIAELTDKHSRGFQIQSETESRRKETEIQLHEAVQKFTQRDSDARDLNEKLLALEDQVRVYEEQVRESVAVVESQKSNLEETTLKLQDMDKLVDEMHSKAKQFETENETLIRTNLTLTQELAEYEAKMNELKAALDAVNAEKEHTFSQLDSSTKVIEDLKQQIASDKEKLDSQISSIQVENNSLNEMHEAAKRELEEVRVQVDEKLNELKERESSLAVYGEKLEQGLCEKALLEARITELEQQLLVAGRKSNEEIQSKEAILSAVEEHAAGLHKEDLFLESPRHLQKEQDLTQNIIATKDKDAVTETTVGSVEVKSRDFVLGTSTTTKRKSKKRSEAVPSETIPAHVSTTDTAHHSGAMAFKFVLGVALVSMVIGVILGKRY
ncbi:DNA repair protein RAD50 ABC-type ATPase/SMC protein [Dioscorea alata]|uniref:DNA repair protein RAD50 ABC-type ATPase/SMC protein n=2 Tax=Dioscorea alata TaxID=55571 RepID=A0ACB7VWL0_DIOAL|nr:DNA repair protein RAD50 ABC-type ATPase/SMC protein [Dioscorea alata]KAH7679117.1 DNA repair protein RAD50 ABC-type ATPase/SMC protein [Dioscorea alata]